MNNLIELGYTKNILLLPENLKNLIQNQDWQKLDKELEKLLKPKSQLDQTLKSYISFTKIEYITSVRDSKNPWEEDGIWHDDGSRVLAFSLSLNLDHEKVEGGKIGFRKKGHEESSILPVQPFGTLIIFATGNWGWEHKVYSVTKGLRVVMAGWCS